MEFFEFVLGPRVVCKPGIVDDMVTELSSVGGTRALIISDRGCLSAGLLERVQRGVAAHYEIAGVFTDVPPNSSLSAVEAGAAYGREVKADVIVALGGGSPIDTAKAVALLLSEGGDIRDYMGYNLLERPLSVPLIAIPTTAGTGSEVTSWSVIRDEEQGVKIPFSSPYLAPQLAILDADLTRSLPPKLTAATGMDALTHAIESYVGTNANYVTDALALQAIEIISNNLRAATHSGDDLDARSNMLIAAMMAGMAFSGGGGSLGIVHAMAHSIGGLYEVHHGTANALLLPHGMRYNAIAVPHRFSRIARELGINIGGRSRDAVIEDAILAVEQLVTDCGLLTRLRDVEVPREGLPLVAEISTTDPALFANPRPANAEEILAVLEGAW